MLANDNAQMIIKWGPTLANFGTDPTLTFQAIVSNPPPQQLLVVLSSFDPVSQIGVDCSYTTILRPYNTNGTVFKTQPQTYTYTFSKTYCEQNFGAPFLADHISQVPRSLFFVFSSSFSSCPPSPATAATTDMLL
jgi:hypothetical protein